MAPVEPAPNVVLEATPSSLTVPALPMSFSNAAAPPPPVTAAPRLSSQAQPAKLISSPPPAYPPMARTQRLQGEVVLNVAIDDSGKVTKVSVISGHTVFQQAAIDAVTRWRYEPARLNGQPVPSQAQVRVFFRP
jgi:protein TonB